MAPPRPAASPSRNGLSSFRHDDNRGESRRRQHDRCVGQQVDHEPGDVTPRPDDHDDRQQQVGGDYEQHGEHEEQAQADREGRLIAHN